MNRKWAVVGLALGMSGCVSSSKYQKLQQDRDALSVRNQVLERTVDQQKTDTAAMQQANTKTEGQYQSLVVGLATLARQGAVKVSEYKNMLTVEMSEKILFASGDATLKPDGQAALLKLGALLKQYPDKLIRVVGHTDNVPPNRVKHIYPTNWELSVARATTVVRFLQEKAGVDPALLIASGRGGYAPVAPNNSEANRAKNRSIEIMLLDKALVDNLEKHPITDTATPAQ